MENKDEKVIELASIDGFIQYEETVSESNVIKTNKKITNPIAKNFAKFALRSKDKFSLKDIFK